MAIQLHVRESNAFPAWRSLLTVFRAQAGVSRHSRLAAAAPDSAILLLMGAGVLLQLVVHVCALWIRRSLVSRYSSCCFCVWECLQLSGLREVSGAAYILLLLRCVSVLQPRQLFRRTRRCKYNQ